MPDDIVEGVEGLGRPDARVRLVRPETFETLQNIPRRLLYS
jgi:hypothetical protein